MYRFRITVQVKYGHFKEHMEICEGISMTSPEPEAGLSRRSGCPPVGVGNQAIIEWEYPDLATFERELQAFNTDAEARALIPGLTNCIVEGSTRQ